jgi:uncharacterized protein YjbJ (UPF0337 family)
MNTDKIKGAIDDAAGRAKRQVGEWTGDTETQVDGAAQQVKGKAEKVVGNIRDAINNPSTTGTSDVDREKDIDDNRDRESVRERE